VVLVLENLAPTLVHLQRPDEAKPLLERAAEIRKASTR